MDSQAIAAKLTGKHPRKFWKTRSRLSAHVPESWQALSQRLKERCTSRLRGRRVLSLRWLKLEARLICKELEMMGGEPRWRGAAFKASTAWAYSWLLRYGYSCSAIGCRRPHSPEALAGSLKTFVHMLRARVLQPAAAPAGGAYPLTPSHPVGPVRSAGPVGPVEPVWGGLRLGGIMQLLG